MNLIANCTLKSISAQFKRLTLLVTECLYTACRLYARRFGALHLFLWRTSALNIYYSVSKARCGFAMTPYLRRYS
jgi:hypothetical protein